jgi:hypothetical protein
MGKTNDKSKDQSLAGIKIFIRIIFIISGVLILAISRYAFIFFIFAILPSITALSMDKRSNKFASSTICAFNITAVMPYLFDFLTAQDISASAKQFIGNIHIWFAIYGTTSLGWVMIWSVPQICGKIFQARALTKIHQLKTRQNAIIEEWGPQIKQN